MIDGIGRNIDYLRISVTDKCNLRCKYCMPKEGIQLMPHDELLTLEEITRTCRIMAGLGIKKIRITGGEPLVRKNIVKLISDINDIPEIEDIAITTNGVLFAPMAKELAVAGLNRVNISLDTLQPQVFETITGCDKFDAVKKALQAAVENGIQLKINCVASKQFNNNEIEDIAGIAKDYPVDVRFIELMPIGCGKKYEGIPSDEILKRLENVYGISKIFCGRRGNGPATYWEFEGFLGKIGFISPMSHKFCSECNRVRMTADGMLKLCLHYNNGVDLKSFLRNENISDEEIKELIMKAVQKKPESHHFEKRKHNLSGNLSEDTDKVLDKNIDNRKMYQIGG